MSSPPPSQRPRPRARAEGGGKDPARPPRAALLALALAGCGGGPDAPWAAWTEADGPLVAGGEADLGVAIRIGAGGLAPGGEVVVALPHPWFGAAGGTPQVDAPGEPGHARAEAPRTVILGTAPPGIDPGALSLRAPRGLSEGDVARVTVRRLRLPRSRLSGGISPEVIVRPAGAAPPFAVAPGAPLPMESAAPERLRVIAPTAVRPGEPFAASVRFEDAFRNDAGPAPAAGIRVEARGEGGGAVPVVVGTAVDGEATGLVLPGEGLAWLQVRALDGEGRERVGTSNPVRVGAAAAPVLFGDLHGHTAVSDGAGTPEDAYSYARDVARVDFAALTEHDWQLDPGGWARVRRAADGAQRPGRFATLHAFEYDLGPHACVYFPGEAGDLPMAPGARRLWEMALARRMPAVPPVEAGARSLDPSSLYRWLGGRDALVVPHTSASPWMGVGLERLHADLSPVIEIYSAHGQSENARGPGAVPGADPEGAVTLALSRGIPLRLLAAGDGHDGRLGRTAWGGHPGGLTAVVGAEPERGAVFRALRRGATYATDGGRPLLEFRAGGVPMGGIGVRGRAVEVRVAYAGEGPVDRVEVLRDEVVVHEARPPAGGDGPAWALSFAWTDPAPPPGRAVYRVRAFDAGGGRAWSSPVWLYPEGAARVGAVGGAPGEESAGVDLRVVGPVDPARLRLLRRVGDDGGGDPSLYSPVAPKWRRAGPTDGVTALSHRQPFASPGQAEAWMVLDVAPDGTVASRIGPLWSVPREEPLPAAAPGIPLPLPLWARPGDTLVAAPVGDRRRVLARVPILGAPAPGGAVLMPFAPPPGAPIEFTAADGSRVQALAARRESRDGWSPWRYVLRPVLGP